MTYRFPSTGKSTNQPNQTKTLESFLKQKQLIFSPSNLYTLKQSTFTRNLKHWESKKSRLYYMKFLRVGLNSFKRYIHTYIRNAPGSIWKIDGGGAASDSLTEFDTLPSKTYQRNQKKTWYWCMLWGINGWLVFKQLRVSATINLINCAYK